MYIQEKKDARIFKKEIFTHNMDNATSATFNNDANFSTFFEDQLRFLDTTVKKVFYAENTFLADVPAKYIDVNTNLFSWHMKDIQGSAKIISDYSDDIPNVGESTKQYSSKPRDLASSFIMSIREMQDAAKLGQQIATDRLETCMLMNMNKINKLVYFGSTEGGNQTYGWLNYAGNGANQTVVTTDVAGANTDAKKWINKTGAAILDDLHEAINEVQTRTAKHTLFQPNRILLPLAQYQLLKTKRLLDTQVTTVFDEFERLYPNVTIEARPILAGVKNVNSFVNSKDVMIVYQNNNFHFEQIILENFAPTQAQPLNLSWKTICTSRHAGVAMYYPESQVFKTGI